MSEQQKQEATHTPGLWVAVKADLYGDGEDSDPNRWAVCAGDPGLEFFVATIENGAPGDTLETEEANARLIASAPDLLAACRKAKGYMDSINARRFHGEFDGESTLLSDHHGLTAAINKALGSE